jgi:hypothetical protein
MRRLLVPLAVLALLLAACGDDDTTTVTDTTTTTTSEPAAPVGEDPDDGDDLDEGDDAIDPDADRPEYTGAFEVDYDTGEVDVAEYAAFLAEHGAPSGGPEAAALEMLGATYAESIEMGTELDVSSEAADGGRTVVTVTYENLPDDSVAAERYELVFVGDGGDTFLESGSWASRCQPGRGHQEFSLGLCL